LNNPWPAEFWRIASIAAAGLLLGLLLGHPWPFLSVALIAYFSWHLYNLYRLERWLRVERSLHPPEAGGIWGDVCNQIYLLQKRNRKRKRRLADILHRFQEATEAMPDAAVVLRENDEIEWINGAAQRYFGLHPVKDRRQRIDNLLRHPGFVQFLDSGGREPFLMPSPTDATMTLSLRVVPYGRHQRLLLARDVSQQQRLDQMRRDFVGNVSHELRTPLTVIAGFLETLEDEDSQQDPFIQRAVTLMQQQTLRMQHIVADLLLLSRLETDRAEPPRERVAVGALLAAIREDAQLLSGSRGHTIALEADPALQVYGAERELHSAFSNLVSNAVRYTPDGGEIRIRWWADREGAHFSVTDSGIGIPPEHIPRLTERFYRVDVGRSREIGGTGLGLAIVKHVLTRHGAVLRVESTVGKGSTFICDLPASRIVEHHAAAAE